MDTVDPYSWALVLPAVIVAAVCAAQLSHLWWTSVKGYPQFASWWLPVVGNLLSFTADPRAFLIRERAAAGGKPFMMDMLRHRFCICDSKYATRMFRSDEADLNMQTAVKQLMNFDFTLTPDLFKPANSHGTAVQILTIRQMLDPNMHLLIPKMVQETVRVAREVAAASAGSVAIETASSGSVAIESLKDFCLDVVAAASSRVLIGDDLSRETELMATLRDFSVHVGEVTALSAVLPDAAVGRMCRKVDACHKVIARFVEPEVVRRRRQQQRRQPREEEEEGVSRNDDKNGDAEQPQSLLHNDFLGYLMEL
jgi:hypothetical protein